jgi:hypothetical protein
MNNDLYEVNIVQSFQLYMPSITLCYVVKRSSLKLKTLNAPSYLRFIHVQLNRLILDSISFPIIIFWRKQFQGLLIGKVYFHGKLSIGLSNQSFVPGRLFQPNLMFVG